MKKTRKKRKLSRRDFVKRSVGAGLAAATAGCASIPGLRGLASVETPDAFDYIVIGSGAGGGPVVANLVNAGYRVCLLEAGGIYPFDPNHPDPAHRNYDVPSFHPFATEDPDMAWNFFVNHYKDEAKQKMDSKYSMKGGGILYPRAATLGGCTAHNAMITLYPDNRDWDDIAAATGDATWASDKMRDYYQRLERKNYGDKTMDGVQRRGHDGWLSVEMNDFWVRVKDLGDLKMHAILSAAAGGLLPIDAVDVGVLLNDPNNWDYVRNKKDGTFLIPKATSGGRRNGTRELILNTKNKWPDRLDIRTNALASKIVLDENRRAVAVEYRAGAKIYRATSGAEDSTYQGVPRKVELKRDGSGQVRGEIILAGGAFNSPQLLLLSGIGTSQQGISLQVPIPGVGKNLQDRYEFGVVSKLKTPFMDLANCTFGEGDDACLRDFDRDPANQMYSSNGAIASNIIRSNPSKTDPDLVLFAVPGKFRGYYPGWSKDLDQKDYMTWAILKGHTFNTSGTVTLKSADPLDTPEINFNYFDAGGDEDLKSVLKGIDVARSINKNHMLLDFIDHEELPAKQGADLIKFVKNEVWGHHASCSNKMGSFDNDPNAVVDSKFRVRGTNGLRIVDASVFPRVPGLFIAVPIYMIAEKASDDIIADAKKT